MLLDSPGWAILKKWLDGQIRLREKDVFAESEGLDHLVVKERVCGERAGMMLALGLPQMLISGADEEIEQLKEEIANETEEGHTDEASE